MASATVAGECLHVKCFISGGPPGFPSFKKEDLKVIQLLKSKAKQTRKSYQKEDEKTTFFEQINKG